MSENGEEKINQLIDLLPNKVKYFSIEEGNDFVFSSNYEMLNSHPYYSDSLLEGLTFVLGMRNSDYLSYKVKSKKNQINFIIDRYTSSIEKPDKKEGNVEIRKIFESIINLIDERAKLDAINSFKELFWKVIECYLITEKKFQRAYLKLTSREDLLEVKRNEISNRSVGGTIVIKYNTYLDYEDEKEEIENSKKQLELDKKDFYDGLMIGHLGDINNKDKYSSVWFDIDIPDPYSVVAGYFFLLEEGDDYAWLLGPAMIALGMASSLLPLYKEILEEDGDYIDNQKDTTKIKLFNQNFYKLKPKRVNTDYSFLIDDINDASLIHLYKNIIPPRIYKPIPFIKALENEDEETKEQIKIAYYYSLNREEKYGDSLDQDNRMKLITLLLKESKQLKLELEQSKSDNNKVIENNKVDNSLIKINEELSLEIEKLRKELAFEVEEKKKAKLELSKYKKECINEIRELHSLRDLIFTLENNNEENDTQNEGFKWPYDTNKQIMVLGGHKEWIKRIKTLLPNVKFLDDRTPTREALKHVDTIFFQTRAGISHPMFYCSIDMAKNLDIPILYFTSSGVYKRAEQIVIYDKNQS